MSAAPEQNGLVVTAKELTKTYQRGREQIRALNQASFAVRRGEFVAIVGPSGAGKTTLLNLVGCMDGPTSGALTLFGRDVQGLKESARLTGTGPAMQFLPDSRFLSSQKQFGYGMPQDFLDRWLARDGISEKTCHGRFPFVSGTHRIGTAFAFGSSARIS